MGFSSNQIVSQLDSLLGSLDGQTTSLSGVVDTTITQYDTLVGSGVSSSNDMNIAALNIASNVANILPDYTNKANNSGQALVQYENDFSEFKGMLNNCKMSKLASMIGKLDINIPMPDIPSIDFPSFGSSEITNAIGDIVTFPIPYLKSVSAEILELFSERIVSLGNGLPEFEISPIFEQVAKKALAEIMASVQKLDTVFQCAASVGTTADAYLTQYNSMMNRIPISPTFVPPTSSKLGLPQKFNVDINQVMTETTATIAEAEVLKTSYNSFNGGMDYARSLTDKYTLV